MEFWSLVSSMKDLLDSLEEYSEFRVEVLLLLQFEAQQGELG